MEQDQLEQIDAYLGGKLSGNALQAFEERLAIDPTFKSLVAEQELIVRTIRKKELKELKKKLSSFHEEMVAAPTLAEKQEKAIVRSLPPKKRNYGGLAIAASLLFLIGGFFIYNNQSNPTKIAKHSPTTQQEDRVAAANKYQKIAVVDTEGTVKKELNLLITPSLNNSLRYTLNKDVLVLFISKEYTSDLEQQLLYREDTPTSYYLKLGDKTYELTETTKPTVAKKIE